jgi:chaperonin GroES
MFEKLQPLGDRVLVKRIEEQEKSAGGIIIPDVAKEKGQFGTVISIGTGRIESSGKTIPMAVKAGDMIYFSPYAGTQAGKDHLVIREDEILAVVKN